jgi:hypothetical protein
MYEEKITINHEVHRKFRKKMSELIEFYADMDISFELSRTTGEQYLKIISVNGENFNQNVRDIKSHITIFTENCNRRLKYRKFEKEKNDRKRIKNAETKIKRNIKEYEENKNQVEYNEAYEHGFKNNMFYGLESNELLTNK